MVPSTGPGVKKRRSRRQKRLEGSELSSKMALMKEMDKELNELTSHVSRLQTSISDEEIDLEKLVNIISLINHFVSSNKVLVQLSES